MNRKYEKPIIVALDGFKWHGDALTMASRLQDCVWGFKVNDLLFKKDGADIIIEELKWYGQVFADIKLHDIPQTVFNQVGNLAERGVDIISVHMAGGHAMVRKAIEAVPNAECQIAAVLALTSSALVKSEVRVNSIQAAGCGCSMIIIPPDAINMIEMSKNDLAIISPGIRPFWYQPRNDHVYTVTPKQAIKNGADLLVIGRPITKADDPCKAVERIMEEIEGTA